MPAMLETDVKNERILKEFIEGDTIYQLILEDKIKTDYIEQLHRMCVLLYAANTNIDYFPTNFVVNNEEIYYVDFESIEEYKGMETKVAKKYIMLISSATITWKNGILKTGV